MADMTDEEIEKMKRDLLDSNEHLLALLADDDDDGEDDEKIWESAGGRQVIFWVLGTILLGVLAFTGGLNAEAITAILMP